MHASVANPTDWVKDKSPIQSFHFNKNGFGDSSEGERKMDLGIPETARDIFEALRSEIVWVHGRWKMYRQLYGTNPERIELLNESAGTFFNQLQWILLCDTVLALTRITDPPESLGRDNLVLAQLIKKLDSEKHRDIIEKIDARLEKIKDLFGPFRKLRNRKIAHVDLMAALKIDHDPLPGISREIVEKALESVRDLMNEFEAHFRGNEMVYEHFVMDADGESLVWQLKRAADYRDGYADGTIPRERLRRSRYYKA